MIISQLGDKPSLFLHHFLIYCLAGVFYLYAGKRRALIPPEVGYVNENLKPIPDEVTIEIYSFT